jgi:hypothetical protein
VVLSIADLFFGITTRWILHEGFCPEAGFPLRCSGFISEEKFRDLLSPNGARYQADLSLLRLLIDKDFYTPPLFPSPHPLLPEDQTKEITKEITKGNIYLSPISGCPFLYRGRVEECKNHCRLQDAINCCPDIFTARPSPPEQYQKSAVRIMRWKMDY